MKSEVHEYDADFYRFLASFAARSAEQIVPLLTTVLPIDSVADFGCGEGAWLSVWRKAGITVMGIDGPYVDRQHLMIDGNEFRAADLSQRMDLGRRFDLVQSLEVAEHIPRQRAADFIEMLTDHGPLVMFSAAVGDRGYVAIDYIRPQIVDNLRIQHWYRHNIVLYAEERHLVNLPDRVRAFRVPENQRLRNYWPFEDRIRHALIRQLPRGIVDFLSRVKAQLEARRMRSAER